LQSEISSRKKFWSDGARPKDWDYLKVNGDSPSFCRPKEVENRSARHHSISGRRIHLDWALCRMIFQPHKVLRRRCGHHVRHPCRHRPCKVIFNLSVHVGAGTG
jgi:hypothetical protein